VVIFTVGFVLFLLIIIYNLLIERKLNKLKLIYAPILFAQSVELDSLYRRSNFLISMYNENEIKNINLKFNNKELASNSSEMYYLIFNKDRSFSGKFKRPKKISNKNKQALLKKLYQTQEKEIEELFKRELYLIENCNESLLESPYLNQCNYINDYYSTQQAVRKAFLLSESENYERLFEINEKDMEKYLELTSMYYNQLKNF
tara:strand:+ start:870 stop:1478 length:609 start_codon:yes stop_codon:yes gene_type:complete